MSNTKNIRILVIDDSKLNRAVLRNTLSEMNMVITECEDGVEGLHAFQSQKFDLILVDTVMPNMDGLTFLNEVKQSGGHGFIPIILMTGNDDLNSKIKSLNIGADDFLQKPVNQKELVARVLSLLRLKNTHDLLLEKNLMIQKEMEAAKKVQQFIIPSDFSHISYPSISGHYLPMEDIGGDFYDCYSLPNGDTGILIADVTGHGIPAALIVTMSKMIFNIYANEYTSTAAFLTIVNSEMSKMLLDNQYITAFYGIYDNKNSIFRFTNAGHTRPIFFRKKTGKILMLDTNGFFIGIQDDPNYEEKAIRVEKGDRLFLYTDGVTELRNVENVEFGEKNVSRLITNNIELSNNEFSEKIMRVLMEHAYKNTRNDDIAFLVIDF